MFRALQDYLAHHHFASGKEFMLSLFPSFKFDIQYLTLFIAFLVSVADKVLGVDAAAFGFLILIMILEVTTGIIASKMRQESFQSSKFSRFTLKLCIYFFLIGTAYLFEVSFESRGKEFAASVFGWFHMFIVVEIVFEYIISITENLATIQGKPKDHWVTKIKEMLKSKF